MNVVLPHSACVIKSGYIIIYNPKIHEDSEVRSPEDLPSTSPSLCCLYNAGSRTPSFIFEFICKAVKLGFSFSGPKCNHRPGGRDGCTVVM